MSHGCHVTFSCIFIGWFVSSHDCVWGKPSRQAIFHLACWILYSYCNTESEPSFLISHFPFALSTLLCTILCNSEMIHTACYSVFLLFYFPSALSGIKSVSYILLFLSYLGTLTITTKRPFLSNYTHTYYNPSNAETTFVKSTSTQRLLKTI